MSMFKVSYYDPFGLWSHVHNEIKAHLPLQSLRIRLPQRPTHIVSNIEINFIPYEKKYTPRTPSTLLQEPLLNLFLVGCDNIDTYRQAVRPQIIEWQKSILTRKDHEWLIIYVTNAVDILRFGGFSSEIPTINRNINQRPTTVLKSTQSISSRPSFHGHSISASGILNQLKGTPSDNMLEKLKSDFKEARRERVTPVRLLDNSPNSSEKWRELIDLFKEFLSTSFNNNYSQFEEEIRKLDSQRRFPGWNFCTFFIIKESIAQAFEAMHLYQESLKIYDELEAVFYHSSEERLKSWFPESGGDDPSDMSANLLDFTRKPYRELIATNSIPLLEFHLYLFSRQMHILSNKMGSLIEFSNRALKFIMSFSSTLLNLKGHSFQTEIFIMAWSYSASTNIFQAIEDVLESDKETIPGKRDDSVDKKLSTLRASILWISKSQLNRLGLAIGHLPMVPPFIYSFTKSKLAELVLLNKESFDTLSFITCPILQALFSTNDSFDSLYLSLSQKLIAEYEANDRPRSTASVHASMAALHYVRGRYSNTIKILEKTAYEYIEEGWLEVSKELLESLVNAYQQTQHWYAQVRLCLRALAVPKLPQTQYFFFVENLLLGLKNLEEEITRPAMPYFKFESIIKIEDSIGMSLELIIKNDLITDVPIDSVKLQLKSADDTWITYNSQGPKILTPGLNSAILNCEKPTSGEYLVDCLIINLGLLTLTQEFDTSPPRLQLTNYSHLLSIVPEFFTDRLILKINASGNKVHNGKVKFENLGPLGVVKCSNHYSGILQSEIDSEFHQPVNISCLLEPTKLSFTIPLLQPDQTLTVHISCTPILTLNTQILLPCNVSYQRLDMTPVEYNENLKGFLGRHPFDVYPNWIPKFSPGKQSFYLQLKLQGSPGHIPFRIFSVKLRPCEPKADYKESILSSPKYQQVFFWKDPLSKFPHVPVLFPGQSLDYLFDYQDLLQGQDFYYPCELRIQYRSIREEVEIVLKNIFLAFIKNEALARHIQAIIQYILHLLIESGALLQFSMSGVLDLRFIDESLFRNPVFSSLIVKFCKANPVISSQKFNEVLNENNCHKYKSLFIPCDLQYPKETVQVKISIPDDFETFKLGESYPLDYTFTLLDSDANSNLTSKEFVLNINSDALADSGFWAISGKTKINLTLEPKDPIIIQITCTPTRSGFIRLPQAQIYSKPSLKKVDSSKLSATQVYQENRIHFIYPQQSQQIRVIPPNKTSPISLSVDLPESIPLPLSPPHPSSMAPLLFSPVLPSSPQAYIRTHQSSFSDPHPSLTTVSSPGFSPNSPPPFKNIPLYPASP